MAIDKSNVSQSDRSIKKLSNLDEGVADTDPNIKNKDVEASRDSLIR